MTSHTNNVEFDQYAEEYDAALAQGLAVSGEDKDFFARGRISWLSACLSKWQEKPQSVMDFGCGTGSATPYLFDLLGVASVVGIDVSPKSLGVASRINGSERTQFLLPAQYQPNSEIDLAFCNGVFHHIPPDQRADAVDYIYRSLRPGGLFSLWENNPWNPGTRYVMHRCPFDQDAITLRPPDTRRLLSKGGLEILQTDFLFIFPRMLRWLRGLEPMVASLPVGAQYQVLCRRPRLPVAGDIV